MEPISEELVDAACEELSGLSPEEGHGDTIRVPKGQIEVLAFIIEMTEDLEQAVCELAVFMFLAVHRMFEKAYGREISDVTSEEIISSYQENERLLESLEGVHEQFFENIARAQMSAQPYVIRYVVETIVDAAHMDDPILLTEEDMGYLFLIMKTVIDVLIKKTDT